MGYWVLLLEAQETNTSLLPLLEQKSATVKIATTLAEVAGMVKQFWPDVIVVNSLQDSPKPFKEQFGLNKLGLPYLVVLPHKPDAEQLDKPLTEVICTPETLWSQLEQTISQKRFIRASDLTLDMRNRSMLYQGHIHKMTPKLLKIFRLLLEHHGEVVSRRTLMNEVWETDYMGDTRTLDVHIRWAREKIEENPSRPQHLITVRGQGYRLVLDTPNA